MTAQIKLANIDPLSLMQNKDRVLISEFSLSKNGIRKHSSENHKLNYFDAQSSDVPKPINGVYVEYRPILSLSKKVLATFNFKNELWVAGSNFCEHRQNVNVSVINDTDSIFSFSLKTEKINVKETVLKIGFGAGFVSHWFDEDEKSALLHLVKGLQKNLFVNQYNQDFETNTFNMTRFVFK